MVICNRYPAHFKYPKANQPEMTFLVSGMTKVGIPNFVSGPREYIMEGEYAILAVC